MKNYRYLKNVSTLAYYPEKCTGCGRCVEVCPHRLFYLQDGKAAVRDRDLCMECGACRRNCPWEAIAVRPGVGCAWAIMLSELKGHKTVVCG